MRKRRLDCVIFPGVTGKIPAQVGMDSHVHVHIRIMENETKRVNNKSEKCSQLIKNKHIFYYTVTDS